MENIDNFANKEDNSNKEEEDDDLNIKDTNEEEASKKKTDKKDKTEKKNKDKKNKNEGQFELTNKATGYEFGYNDESVTIYPSNKSDKISDIYFFYNSSPKIAQNYKFSDIDPRNYKLISDKNTFIMTISTTESPLLLNVNNHSKIFEFEKATTGNTSNKNKETTIYNIIYYKTKVGNLKIIKENNKTKEMIIKTTNKEIKDNPDYLTAIFTGFLIFDALENVRKVDIDKNFKNDKEKKK